MGDVEVYTADEIESLAGVPELTARSSSDSRGQTFDGFPCLRTVGGSVGLFEGHSLGRLSWFPALTRIGGELRVEGFSVLAQVDDGHD